MAKFKTLMIPVLAATTAAVAIGARGTAVCYH